MRKTPYKTWLVVGFFLLMPWVAHAVGLGKLTILSALGQPLLAEVELVSVQTDELATLVARLARPEAYTQANISYSPALVGVRLSIERRAGGQPYIKIISTRPVNEPFIDLLVELNWTQGRLVREYTALIDPIGYTPAEPIAPVAPSVAVTPPVTLESQPIAPAPQPPVAAAAAAADKAYGPVKRGETLFRIASKVKPEGVTLEQMLVSLYHANPDAFAANMNRLKTGKILRVPEKERVIATGQSEAVKEVRVQAADWNVYRQKLAEAAGETPARESKSAASGKITTKVDDKAAGKAAPKEVLKLSKGEPTAGKASDGKGARRSVTNRIRVLEEEVIAREKALAEAHNRIAQLEKTLNDIQRVTEIKAPAPVAKPAPKPPPAPEPDLIEQIMREPAYLAAGGGVLALVGVGGYLFVRRRRAQAGSDEPTGGKIEPEIGKRTVAAGGGVLALLVGYLSALRRRAPAGDGEVARERIAPELGEKAAATAKAMPAAGGEAEVDPLAEADMYLNFGRDVQAEEVLKEVLEKTPNHEEARLKLLQIYAGRKDKAAFEKIAQSLYAQTKGTGDNWVKAASMGYAFDSANTLYEAGKSAPVATPVAGGASAENVDFELDVDAAAAAEPATTDFLISPATAAAAEPATTDFLISPATEADTMGKPEPVGNARGDDAAGAQVSADAAAPISNLIDFQFDTAPAAVAAEAAADGKGSALDGTSVPVKEGEAAQQPAEANGDGVRMLEPDFKLDFNIGGAATAAAEEPALKLDEISLNFEAGPGAAAPPAESGTRDDHWRDVQTKFDLAKAYQEMGEKGGAREILQEVIKEGDAGQRAEAQKLLESLA